ncbi:MAG: FAD synthetase [Sphaerochaetaceae bacterium]|nr:FAD synthetase [Sphaerochaetaceae bacterium]
MFDGLHQGHEAIVNKTIEIAKKNNINSVVISFSVNPKMAAGAMAYQKPLNTQDYFFNSLERKGLDYHCVIDFSHNMSKLTGEEFIALLCTSYSIKAMVVGDSFRCGVPTSDAGIKELPFLLSKYTNDAFLEVVNPVIVDGEVVSSSLIRRCILTGDVGKASTLLGRAYSLDLRGVKKTLASSENRLFYEVCTLGQLIPKEGLYMVEATEGEVSVKGSLSISGSHLVLELPVQINPDEIVFPKE